MTIAVNHNGTVRELTAFTDGQGNFVREFQPLPTEGGTYQINAYFPGNKNEDSGAEDTFKLLGMRFSTTSASHKVIADSVFTSQISLENLTNIGLTGITASVIGAPSSWQVQINTPSQLAGDGTNTISYTITAPNNSSIVKDTFDIKLISAEGVMAVLPVTVDLQRTVPRLVASTTPLNTGMLRGSQNSVEFTVTNEGGAVAQNIQVVLPQASWLSLASPVTIPYLSPGESTKVTLLLTPEATLPLTQYQGNIVLDAIGNDGDLTVPFTFKAVSNAIGEVKLSVVDELFYFTQAAPKLEGATVILQDYFTNEVVRTVVTDATGMITLSNLAEGYYNLEITAEDHDTYRQTIQIDAGEIENINAFLSKQTVKYIWKVQETEIEDRYSITVQSVFETDVPIPTVVIQTPVIDLADLQVVGQVTQIEITLTNEGLIAANNINLNFGEHPFYKIELLFNSVDTLAAKSSITVPVKITRIADFAPDNNSSELVAQATQPSVPCDVSFFVNWSYPCGPQEINKSTEGKIINVEGNCPPSLPGGGGGGGGGGISSATPIISESNLDCCLEIPLFKLDVSGYLEPFVTTAEAAINAYIKAFGEVELDIEAFAEVETCCDPFGLKFTAQATASAEFKAGPAFEAEGSIGVPEADLPFGIESISLSGSAFIGIQASLSASITGIIVRCCDGQIEYGIAGEIGLGFQAGATGQASAKVDLIDETEIKLYEGTAQAGLFGGVTYKFLYSPNTGWVDCFESEGIYATVVANIPEIITYSLYGPDNPDTDKREDRNYFIEPVSIGDCDQFEEGLPPICEDEQTQSEPNSLHESPQEQSNSIAPITIDPVQAAILQNLANHLGQSYASLEANYLASLNPSSVTVAAQDSVCARVKLQIDQSAIMTRSAFLGELEIDNGNISNLENLSVTLQVKDAQGNVVNHLFGITNPILKNITAVDGTGILTKDNPNTPQDEGIGSAKWTFIPTGTAAPNEPTTYSIGGTLSYTENGTVVTVPLLSTPITVYPQAELHLDYFHQRDVFADDPFTKDVVEPSVPYSLAVLVRNEGKGDAKNLQIISSQPKIIENEKGLLINFEIIGSQLNNQPITPSLSVNFGNIEAGETAVADWLLKSSLQGKFIDYSATFEHLNDLGNPELSLIKDVSIHELIHQVQANSDGLPDFLVNDTFDANFYPDMLYFSNGGTAPVNVVTTATSDGAATPTDLQVQITATTPNAWTYLRLVDPADGQFQIQKVLRSDGTEVRLENIWRTDRTFPATGQPTYENILHLLDYNSTGQYTITYANSDTTGPSVQDIIDVVPDPRITAVTTVDVVFSETINASTFTSTDLTLTRNGGSNLITNAVAIIKVNDTTYRISGLDTLTTTDGEYLLSVNASGIEDLASNAGIGSASDNWTKISFTPSSPVTVTLNPTQVTENGNLNLIYTFTRTGDTTNSLTVNFSVSGTATFNNDYKAKGATSFTATNGTITFAAGKNTAILTLDPSGDVIIEPDETINLTLVSGIGYTIGTPQSLSGTIINDDGTNNNDNLVGSPGNDSLDGGLGDDTMTGGLGSDIYGVDSLGDVIVENAGEGTDTVKTFISYNLGNHLENLTLLGTGNINGTGSSGNNTLIGNTGNNTLTAGGGNDSLNGGLGTDVLSGGTGNDSYTINAGDTIIENSDEGIDSVNTGFTFTLGDNIENLTLNGQNAINGTGNNFNNSLNGNSGNNLLLGLDENDFLDGKAGNDTLEGGTGNDTYTIDAGDTITESANSGIDTVKVGFASYTLSANLENLTLTGTSVINGTGNSNNNLLAGNNAANILTGLEGNDTLTGGSGNDTLVGGNGNDVLTGSTGQDQFVLNAPGNGLDSITDFKVVDDTLIVSVAEFGGELTVSSSISFSQFHSGAGASTATTAAHRFIYNSTNGALFFDPDGTSAIAPTPIATLSSKLTMTNLDILAIA